MAIKKFRHPKNDNKIVSITTSWAIKYYQSPQVWQLNFFNHHYNGDQIYFGHHVFKGQPL